MRNTPWVSRSRTRAGDPVRIRAGATLISLAFALVVATSATAQDPQAGPSRAEVLGKEPQLELAAKKQLGEKWFGCVTVPGKNDPDAPVAGMRLFLTSKSKAARRAARRVIGAVGAQAFTTIRYIAPRYGWAADMRIERYLRTHVPAGDRDHISFGGTVNDSPTRCPKVLITVRELASQAAHDWAYAAQRAFGADRVAVYFPPPGTPVPD